MKQPPIKTKELSGSTVQIADGQNWEIASITAYGETPQGGTTDAPVALTGVDSVFVGGRNLLPMATETKTLNGVTFTPNPNGSVSVSGTATNIAAYVFANGLDDSLLGQTLCLSGDSMQTQLIINEMKPTGEWIRHVFIRESTPSAAGILSKQAEANILYATIAVPAGTTVNTTVYPMLNLSESPLPYEPYRGSVTPLPIPRPLHKVGDVRDVCRTRVKSVYDKRIVLDGSEMWTEYTDENWQGAGYHVYRFYNADALISQYIASNKYPSRRGDSNFKGTLGVTSGAQSILFSVVEQKTVDDWKAYLAAQKAAGTPVIIYRQSTAYDGTNGLDVCLTEYQTGYIESYADESITTAWISSTGALSTGAEVAYVLSSPETYATDPIDFDNAAGPLTVMAGGELEVTLTHRMLTPYTTWAIRYDSEGEYTGDFFNVEDYDRIKQNIEYLREYAYFLYGGFTMRGMVAVTVESYGYASTIDALDANLEAIAANTFRPPDMMPVKQWRGNQPPPGADDWNRIENTCLLLFEQFERQFACLPKLAFELKGSAF